MKAPFFDKSGKSKGTVDLAATHFEVTPNLSLIHRLLVLQQANARNPIAHTKLRGEIAGSTKKMYKQKGTGASRVGDRRSPTRRGGGVTFGPRNDRNFTLCMNKQERRLALTSLLSLKAADEGVKVIADLPEDGMKTKGMKSFLSTIDAKKPLLALTSAEHDQALGAWNLIDVKVVNVEYLNPHSLMKYKDLIFTEASLAHLYEHFSK